MAFYTNVDATKKFRLGTRIKDKGNEYIYLQGVASVVDGDWVVFDHLHVTTRAIADEQGRVGIANAAVDATTKFGWFTIYGVEDGLCLASFDGTNGAGVWLTSTAGSVDDTEVAGDAVVGAIGRTDRDATTGMAKFELNYPCVLDHVV